MIKREQRPDIYLLLLIGVKPQTLVKLGYSQQTIYKYQKRLNFARIHIDNQFRKQAKSEK